MISTSEFKKHGRILVDGDPFVILDVHVQSPSARGASSLSKIRVRNLRTGQVLDKTFRGGDKVEEPNLELRAVQFLYQDGDGYHFMDQESYETLTLSGDILGEDRKLLVDNVNVQIHKYNGNPIGLQLPPHVELKVTYTEPGVRGDTASGGVTKLATLETGLEIRVPLFIKEGEKVKVHTTSWNTPCSSSRVTSVR
jgi:elongation factor P